MGTSTQLDDTTIAPLTDDVHGEVLLPDDDGYEEARTIWNAMIDREPAVIARCTGAADVMSAVDFARDNDLLIAVKGGGHKCRGEGSL